MNYHSKKRPITLIGNSVISEKKDSMQFLHKKIRKKYSELTDSHGLFRNESGAIDLASIMVGIIVIGLIGGVIATTVFAVIPWAQDNAAKQQLDSVTAAQSAYKGLSSGIPPAVPTGHPANSYASSTQLEEANLLAQGEKYCTVTTDEGEGFTAFTRSDSGKIWFATDKNTAPDIHVGILPADCNFLNVNVSADDLDGDGIPNAEDRDADGDGIQDGYVPGGPIATIDGTPYATGATYHSTILTNGGTTITSNVVNSSAQTNRKVSMHLIVSCVKEDGSFYTRNFLNGYTTPSSSVNSNINTVPCQPGERVDEYTVKPVTKEAMESGEIENPEYFGGWTFLHNGEPGGVHWSEPDGYPALGEFYSSILKGGGSTLDVTFKTDAIYIASQVSTAQYELTCERPDQSTYNVKALTNFTSKYRTIEYKTVSLTACGTDLVTAYNISPVTKLGEVANPETFTTGLTIRGSKSWTDAEGYPKSGNFQYANIVDGGSAVSAAYRNDDGVVRTLTSQYELTCERPDKSNYNVNRMASFTTQYNTIQNHIVKLTGCGSDDVITAYEIFPVNDLGDAENRSVFAGFGIEGSKSWNEEKDGYPVSGYFRFASVTGGGTTVTATYRNDDGVVRTLTTQYTMTCERPDKTTYSVNRMASFATQYNTIQDRNLVLTGCGTDQIAAYSIFPVNDLGDAENRSVFAGTGIKGSYNWTRP